MPKIFSPSDLRHQNPGRPTQNLPPEERKKNQGHYFRPREHAWIQANKAFIEKQAAELPQEVKA